MTSPYTTEVPAVPVVRAPGRSWGRIVLSVLVVLAGIAGAIIAAIIAAITWTGCFIQCSEGNHAGGAALAGLAAISLASGPAAVSGLYRSARWMWVAGWTAVGGFVLAMLVVTTA